MIMAEEKKIIAYKGFDKDMKYKDFQYEVGKKYQADEVFSWSNRLFNACESPLELWKHFDMLNSRFARVEASGNIYRNRRFTEIRFSCIEIKEELNLADIIKLGVKWLEDVTSPSNIKADNTLKYKDDKYARIGLELTKIGSNDDDVHIGLNHDYAQIGLSGDYAQIGLSGSNARIGTSGNNAQIGSSGTCTQIGSSGNTALIGSSGRFAHIGSSGFFAQIGSSGIVTRIGSSGNDALIGSIGSSAYIGSSGSNAQIGSSGDYAQIVSSGFCTTIGAIGHSAKIGSSGDCANIMSSGNNACIGSSGRSVLIKSSGDLAMIASSGEYAEIDSTGENSAIMCTGCLSKVKAKKGSWITLAEWERSPDNAKKYLIPVCVRTEYVDGERIKADTWYRLINGKFKEVQP